MPSPVLIYADEAAEIAAALAPRFPGERLMPVSEEAALDAAFSEGPEVAFTIKSRALGPSGHRRVAGSAALRLLQIGGSGYEHIGDWDRTRLTVANCVGVLAPFLAESCIGAMLALNHGLIAYRDNQRRRLWRERPFRPLAGQRLLVVGAGAIGGELSARAAALGMEVVAIRRSSEPVPGAREVRRPEALARSLGEADIVSNHLRLTDETRGIFGAAAFAAMRPGALFLNTARGGHVVEADLFAALASGHLGGAYLDVFEAEPLPPDSPLWAVPGLLISPHSSDGVSDWLERFTEVFARNLAAFRAGHPLVNVV